MKIALCSRSLENSWKRGEISFLDFIYLAKRYDIFAIDILASHVPDLIFAKELHHAIEQEHMQVVNYSTRLTAVSALADSLSLFEEEFEKAAILGSPYIGIRTDTGKESPIKGSILRDVLVGYERLIGLATKYGLKMLIENNKGISSSPDSIELVISHFKRHVYACLDTGNFPASHRYSSNKRLIPLSTHCHFKTLEFDEEGRETTIDTALCVSQLVECNYSGFIAVEYEGGGDEKLGIEKSIILLTRLLPKCA